jgi:hypothetical protein
MLKAVLKVQPAVSNWGVVGAVTVPRLPLASKSARGLPCIALAEQQPVAASGISHSYATSHHETYTVYRRRLRRAAAAKSLFTDYAEGKPVAQPDSFGFLGDFASLYPNRPPASASARHPDDRADVVYEDAYGYYSVERSGDTVTDTCTFALRPTHMPHAWLRQLICLAVREMYPAGVGALIDRIDAIIAEGLQSRAAAMVPVEHGTLRVLLDLHHVVHRRAKVQLGKAGADRSLLLALGDRGALRAPLHADGHQASLQGLLAVLCSQHAAFTRACGASLQAAGAKSGTTDALLKKAHVRLSEISPLVELATEVLCLTQQLLLAVSDSANPLFSEMLDSRECDASCPTTAPLSTSGSLTHARFEATFPGAMAAAASLASSWPLALAQLRFVLRDVLLYGSLGASDSRLGDWLYRGTRGAESMNCAFSADDTSLGAYSEFASAQREQRLSSPDAALLSDPRLVQTSADTLPSPMPAFMTLSSSAATGSLAEVILLNTVMHAVVAAVANGVHPGTLLPCTSCPQPQFRDAARDAAEWPLWEADLLLAPSGAVEASVPSLLLSIERSRRVAASASGCEALVGESQLAMPRELYMSHIVALQVTYERRIECALAGNSTLGSPFELFSNTHSNGLSLAVLAQGWVGKGMAFSTTDDRSWRPYAAPSPGCFCHERDSARGNSFPCLCHVAPSPTTLCMHVWRIFYALRPFLHTNEDRVYADEVKRCARTPQPEHTLQTLTARLTAAVNTRTCVVRALQDAYIGADGDIGTVIAPLTPMSLLATLITRPHCPELTQAAFAKACGNTGHELAAVVQRHMNMLTFYSAPLDTLVAGSLTDDVVTFSPCALKTLSSRHLGDALLHPDRIEQLEDHAELQETHQSQGGVGLAAFVAASTSKHTLAAFADEPVHVYNTLRRELLLSTSAAAAAQSHCAHEFASFQELPAATARVDMDNDVCGCSSPVQMFNPLDSVIRK